MAQLLIYPKHVSHHNIEKLRQCVRNGANKYPGARFLKKPDVTSMSLGGFLFKVRLKQQDGVDIYNFLHLLRSISKGQEMSTACLGAEIDDLELDDENMELGLSPEHISSFGKHVFEDSAEFDTNIDNQKMEGIKTSESSWEKIRRIKTQLE
ncbi:unnamed protein product [Ilex paraguariensis]|uniref:RNA polymerase alpha subunit domain-containing protein n=1 Tax=Ilex paraguariensis TaxID=185542 RepID=A0ABC8UNV7_9AQUA